MMINLLLSSHSFAAKALWWNIGGANFKNPSIPAAYSKKDLEKNLLFIIKAYQPDALFLGEYYQNFLSSETINLIKNTYPHAEFFAYNSKTDLGIISFSKTECLTNDSEYHLDALEWKPSASSKKLMNTDFQNYPDNVNNTRSFQACALTFQNQTIALVPVHTIMPWNALKSDQQGLSKYSESLGKLEVGYKVLNSVDNPLGYQSDLFQKELKTYQNRHSTLSRIIVFGDLNVPASYFGVTSDIWKILKGDLEVATNIGEIDYTIPATPEAINSPKIQIDHVFATTDTNPVEYKILNIQGSDHLPVLMKF